jgi:hypothetical protein
VAGPVGGGRFPDPELTRLAWASSHDRVMARRAVAFNVQSMHPKRARYL